MLFLVVGDVVTVEKIGHRDEFYGSKEPRHNKLIDLFFVVQASRLRFQAGGTPAPQKR